MSTQNAFYHTLGSDLFFFAAVPKKIILIATFVEDTDREEESKKCRTNKFSAWLKAKARVTDAEERLSDMFDKAESFLRSLHEISPRSLLIRITGRRTPRSRLPCGSVVRRNARSTRRTPRSAQRTASC